MIEENGGPEGLDLSEADLTEIDLGGETIGSEFEKVRKDDPKVILPWVTWYGTRVPLVAINLEGANLQGANLFGANLQGADLRSANLQTACLVHANLREARLFQANLEGADLHSANLREARLSGARLQEARLTCTDLRGAGLANANLQGNEFQLADLQGADLWGAYLQGADLSTADLRGAFFYRVRLDHTVIRRESLGPAIGEELAKRYDDARDAYLRLKQNFDALGDYAASAWAYQKERQMEKECNAPWRTRGVGGMSKFLKLLSLLHARQTGKWILDWIVEYLCGYGENTIRVVLWMAASLIVFATYYWSIGGVWLVEPGKGPIVTASSFWHYLIYSLGAFTTTQFAVFQAADDRVRLVTAAQAIWGIFLAGLLGFVVANKIRRS